MSKNSNAMRMDGRFRSSLRLATPLIMLLLAWGLPRTAYAGFLYTYTYTGNSFTSFTGGDSCPPQCHLSLSLTLNQPLADNLVFTSVLPLTYHFTDGVNVLDPSNSSFCDTFDCDFWTDASGTITGWFINIVSSGSPNLTQLNTTYQTEFSFIINADETEQGPCSGASCTVTAFASNSADPGTWQVTAVATPEPGPEVLLVAGLFLGLMRRRRAGRL